MALLNWRSPKQVQAGKRIQLRARHAMCDPELECLRVGTAHLLERRITRKDRYGEVCELGTQTQKRLDGKFRHMHTDIKWLRIFVYAHAASLFHSPGRSDCGGLRIGTMRAFFSWNRLRSVEARYRIPVMTLF